MNPIVWVCEFSQWQCSENSLLCKSLFANRLVAIFEYVPESGFRIYDVWSSELRICLIDLSSFRMFNSSKSGVPSLRWPKLGVRCFELSNFNVSAFERSSFELLNSRVCFRLLEFPTCHFPNVEISFKIYLCLTYLFKLHV